MARRKTLNNNLVVVAPPRINQVNTRELPSKLNTEMITMTTMIPRFQRMRVTCEKEKSIEWGRYEVQKHNVTVWASHPWHDVKFELRIIPKAEGVRGRFCALAFERHLSSASGNFDEYWSRDLVDYKVPSSEDGYFRFLTDSRL